DAFENVLARARDDLRNNLREELVAVSGCATIVGLEDEPSVGGGGGGPLVPVGFEVIAIGVGGAAMDEGQHGQVLGFEFSWRIDKHSFDGGAVGGLPLILGTLGEMSI